MELSLKEILKIQTRQVLSNLRTLLEDAESGMENVVKVSIYLENIEDFGVVNVLFAEAFGDHKPARSTIAVKSITKKFFNYDRCNGNC